MSERVIDLDKFAVEHFYHPWLPDFPEGMRKPRTVDDVYDLIRKDEGAVYVREAVGRAKRIWGRDLERLSFPAWIVHPFVDWLYAQGEDEGKETTND